MSLDISTNHLGRGALKPNGWTEHGADWAAKWGRDDEHYETDMGGVIAFSDGIKNNGAITTITFGDKQAVTMKTDMTEADLSGKQLGTSCGTIAAAFLPKCQ